ncbi:MAG: RNA pseudouridine synthase [Bacteroidetes bacterium]|nr:MAG: RNA pseudouridine synthase [Bacteroidota bacterium]
MSFDHEQKPGDWVIYNNNQLLAANKPAGIPVQSDKTGDKSLLNLLEIFAKHPLHLIHRLDRPASGVVLFAKNKKALAHLNAQFRERKVEKTYLAVVPKKDIAPQAVLTHYLTKNGRLNRAFASETPLPNAKEARLSYRIAGTIDHYHLLEIDLTSGRHHQIRAQLAALGLPIKGDVKYGARRGNRDRSIHLHAYRLAFRHPVSGEREVITAPLPDEAVWRAFDLKMD